jgi:transcriptional regulator with XRE-family HTH domain
MQYFFELFFTFKCFIFVKPSIHKGNLLLIRMSFENKINQLRKERGLSREELGKVIGTSAAIIGRYERGDMKPSIEIATKIAQALEVSLDYLAGNSTELIKDKKILERLENIAKMPDDKKTELFNVIDAYIRDFRTKQAYL